jgi:hypothetical protein
LLEIWILQNSIQICKKIKETKIKTKSTATGSAHPTPARPITARPVSASARACLTGGVCQTERREAGEEWRWSELAAGGDSGEADGTITVST